MSSYGGADCGVIGWDTVAIVVCVGAVYGDAFVAVERCRRWCGLGYW